MLIKDEIHGTLEFNDLEAKVIDSSPFQRLRRIKQMSVANLIYPGANHTRFEHSLGTSHLSYLISKKLDLEEDTARQIKLYGLLHDIGHTAFSHEGEDMVKKYIGDHESLGKKLITSGQLADIVSENFDPKKIATLGESALGQIVSSDIGSDRMDYLKRDAHNTGVAYGMIDIDRLINTLIMVEDQSRTTDRPELCIIQRGLEAAEYLLIARFMMFSTVYLHHTVRIATAMLYRAIEDALSDKSLNPYDLAKIDDEEAFGYIIKSSKGGYYAKALRERKLYKEVYSIDRSNCPDPKKLEDELKKHFNFDILVDYPWEFFKKVSIRIKTDQDKLVQISELSSIVQSLKKAEEERMKVLILVPEHKQSEKDKIVEFVKHKF